MLHSTDCTESELLANFNSSVSCWSVLEPALDQLFPLPAGLSTRSTLNSDDFLRLYTVVFEHCVGSIEGVKTGGSEKAAAGFNISGEELYMRLVNYLSIKLTKWSNHLVIYNIIFEYSITFYNHRACK